MNVSLESYLSEVLRASERAANVARLCRAEHELFHLLVAEKEGEERNKQFRSDFKTLADVLIQETVRHYLGQKYPPLAPHILGEESSQFTNALGHTITVQVCDTQALTEDLLVKVLDGNRPAASLLARAVHEELPLTSLPPHLVGELKGAEVDVSQLGIWIDPIDCTSEYVKGTTVGVTVDGLKLTGLGCVTVLIGTFLRSSGQPVIGVVNQPFWQEEGGSNDAGPGRAIWGVACSGRKVSNVSTGVKAGDQSVPRVAISGTENASIVKTLSQTGWEVLKVAGAGYKLLCVIEGHVDCYLATGGSSHRWDTCGPHAVLEALGGGVSTHKDRGVVVYHKPDNESVSGGLRWRNSRGIIAYRDLNKALRLSAALGIGSVMSN